MCIYQGRHKQIQVGKIKHRQIGLLFEIFDMCLEVS